VNDSQPPPDRPPSAPPPLAGVLGPPPVTQPQPEPKRRNALDAYVGLPETGWNGLIVLAGIATAIVLLGIGTATVAIFDPGLDTTAGRDVAQLAVGLALGGTALIFALTDAGGRWREAIARLGLGKIFLRTLGMAALAWLAYLAIARLAVPLLQPEQEDVTNQLGTDENSVIGIAGAAFLIVIVAPLSEELFFRGFMYAGLRRSLPLWPAALISALIWGSLHLGGGNVGVAVQLSIFGVILAWLYERSGTLWAPIFAHMLNNTIAFTLLVTGVDA
jgi:membrane protease YdiL (CAAX protease family)